MKPNRSAAAATCMLVAAGVAFAVVQTSPSAPDIGRTAGLIGLIGLVAILPLRWLPGLALALYVLLPQQWLGGGLGNGIAPATVALAGWSIRSRCGQRRYPFHSSRLVRVAQILTGALLLWSAITVLWSVDVGASERWIMSFSASVALVLFADLTQFDPEPLYKAFAALTIAAAIYAVAETALSENFVYGSLYDVVGRTVSQQWSAYRAHASFGHPLYAGTYFAVALVLALSRFLNRGGSLLWLLSAGIGLALTLSRGSIIAAAVGAVLALVVSVLVGATEERTRGAAVRTVVAALGMAIVIVGLVPYALAARADTVEGASSSASRDALVDVVGGLVAASYYRGSGAGTADLEVAKASGGAFPAENSGLQLLVSLGVPGLVLGSALLLSIIVTCLWRSSARDLAPLVTLVLSILGYNALETLLPQHVLIGLIILVALHSDATKSARASRRLRPSRRLTSIQA